MPNELSPQPFAYAHVTKGKLVPFFEMTDAGCSLEPGRYALFSLDQQDTKIAEITAERDHWKNNHDNMILRNSFLSQRLDLPVDRIPAYTALEAELNAMRSAFHVNMMVAHPNKTHAEISSEIEKQFKSELNNKVNYVHHNDG
jgi:hypothetical protein